MCDHCGCRHYPAIAELSAEHEEILGVAWELSELVRSGRGGPSGPGDELRTRLLAMLDIHVRAEETALYPLLVARGDLTPERSDGLEDEHAGLAGAIDGGDFDRRWYYELAAHIEEEEMELFPAAMFGFEDEDWDVLDATERFVPHHAGAA